MSLRALNWAFNLEAVQSSRKFVLVALANYASETGKAYPSVETICRLTSQQDATVRGALHRLVKDKVIKDTKKTVGATGRIKVYQLPDAACEIPPEALGFEKQRKSPRESPDNPPANPLEIPPDSGGITGTGNLNIKTETKEVNAPPFPESLRTPRFQTAWTNWVADRKERRKPVTSRAAEIQLKKCAAWGEAKAVAAIENSIAGGWQGLFEPKENGVPVRNGGKESRDEMVARMFGQIAV